MSSGQNYMSNSMPCTNQGRPLSVETISGFPEVSQMGYWYMVVPIGCEGLVQPRKGQSEARPNEYCINFVGQSYIYIMYIYI